MIFCIIECSACYLDIFKDMWYQFAELLFISFVSSELHASLIWRGVFRLKLITIIKCSTKRRCQISLLVERFVWLTEILRSLHNWLLFPCHRHFPFSCDSSFLSSKPWSNFWFFACVGAGVHFDVCLGDLEVYLSRCIADYSLFLLLLLGDCLYWLHNLLFLLLVFL